ncbi:tigger transposable element-derived protein 4-like isoform X2 [Anopheles aquasalis]|uniref:tigger transposable element-derived protein 4-like isoform X2 n=1 Tax=Anopheles aquasalis TaxID=42839 RepID=UPI00215AEE7D|nr:tigger transposable element-derived protein 4-like isoform X2 [Anopheles aquasalis]
MERAMKMHPASVQRETDSVSNSTVESIFAADMTTEGNGCRTSRLLERIAQFAPKDVFYVDELIVPVGGGAEMQFRQQLNSLLATNMDGSLKLPLLVFGDSIQQNTLHEMGELPVVYLKQKTTLSTQEALPQWLHMVDHMFARIAKEVLMIIREATVAGSMILQTKFTSLTLHILPTKEHLIEKSLRQGITETLKACYEHIVNQQQQQQVAPELALKESVFTLHRCWKEELKPSTIWNSFVEAGIIDSIKGQPGLIESTTPLNSESEPYCSNSDCGSSSSAYDIWNLGDEDIEVLDTDSEDDWQGFPDAEIESRSTHTVIEDRSSIERAEDIPPEPETEVMLQASKLMETANIQDSDLQGFSDAEIESRSTHNVIEDRSSIERAEDIPPEPETEVMLQASKLTETANIQDSEGDLQGFSDAEIESRSTHTVIEDRSSIERAEDIPPEPQTEVMLQASKLTETANIQVDMALDIVYRRLLQLKGVSASVFEKFFKLEHFVKQQQTSEKDCVRKGP